MDVRYPPEGGKIHTTRNRLFTSSPEGLEKAYHTGEILEARTVVCDSERNLRVDLGEIEGVIPRSETALGMDTGRARDIAVISRVGKPVCFRVSDISRLRDPRPVALLSRRRAQAEAQQYFFDHLRPGCVIPARVTRLEHFGAFVDIGCGIISLVGIENISVSRISHPNERFAAGQDIHVLVTALDRPEGRVLLSHRELLGTWEQNAAAFSQGDTVEGIVRGVEQYGIFIELTPNLSGLAEYRGDISAGQLVSVYIKSILPERMKIKLSVIDVIPVKNTPAPLHYYITGGFIEGWRYSPENCMKTIETVLA